MIHLQIEEAYDSPGIGGLLSQAAEAAIIHQAKKNASLTIVLTDDAQVQKLNRDFLGEDAPTDVLSFPSNESRPGGKRGYLGDVVISYPRAAEQAEAGGHSLEEELQLLVVHAVLHLLGYDHAEEEEKARMWEAQGEILMGLGVGIEG